MQVQKSTQYVENSLDNQFIYETLRPYITHGHYYTYYDIYTIAIQLSIFIIYKCL